MTAPLSFRHDVVVKRCAVEVVRYGGWSWGPDPELLTRRVLEALPELLANELGGLPDDGEDIEITEPVRLDVRVRLPDLLAGSLGRITASPGQGRRLADAVGRAVATPAPPYPAAFGVSTMASASVQGLGAFRVAARSSGPPIVEFVTELTTRRELTALLGLLPRPVREGVVSGLIESVGATDSDRLLPTLMVSLARSGELDALLDLIPTAALAAWRTLWTADTPAAARSDTEDDEQSEDHTSVAAALAAAFARRHTDTEGRPLLEVDEPTLPGSDRSASAGPTAGSSGQPSVTEPLAEHSPPDPLLAVPVPAAGPRLPRRSLRSQVEVASALPFLIAGPLARLGVMDALTPALAATCSGDEQRLLAETQLVAAALAYTVLTPLHRGWLRPPEARAAAAAFADLDEVPDEALADMARRAADAASVLDAVVALALCRGHVPDHPLLLSAVSEDVGGGLLLTDPDGLFPIGWTDEPDVVRRLWSACGRPIVLLGTVPEPGAVLGAVEPECLRVLAAAGMRFATDLPSARGEQLRRLPGRSLWASPDLNGAAGPGLIAQLTLMPDQLARLDDLIRALAVSRRATPLAPSTALARTLPLIAALGLGTMSWLLWKEREQVDPLLALERLGDLSGVVRFDRDEVAVVVPLGRRHADLLRHGLLANVRAVPWLGGRMLTFSGG